MKTRIKIVTNANDVSSYQPQYQSWFGIWRHFMGSFPLHDDWIISLPTETQAREWIQSHFAEQAAKKEAAEVKKRSKQITSVTYKDYP